MSAKEDAKHFTINGGVHLQKPASVQLTRWLHRVLPLSWQRVFRDGGAFRVVADGGVILTAGVTAVLKPRLAARFVAVSLQKRKYRYGPHPRQVIEVVHGYEDTGVSCNRRKLIVFMHGGAWGSGCTWMYRAMVDRLSQIGYTVASVGYRVYPDAGTSAQVDDLAAAMEWMAANVDFLVFNAEDVSGWGSTDRAKGSHVPSNVTCTQESTQETFGLDGTNRHENDAAQATRKGKQVGAVSAPEVYLMGHSSGAHICLLYLIRRVEEGTNSIPSASAQGGSVYVEDEKRGREGGSVVKELEVEGLIGLSGVYDIHRHYLYESWRGVHEISPMKASNGGHLHTLFDYSHPFLLGGRPTRSPPPTTLAAQVESKQNTEATKLISAVADSISGIRQNGDIDSALPGDPASGDKGYKRADGSSSGNSGCEPAELVGGGKVRLGRRLPRTFLWHGTADATVPFSQSTELAATLRRIGVPTTTYFAPGGDHFDPVGQLMFGKETIVEAAVVEFTSQEAADRTKWDRQDLDLPLPRSRL